MQNLRDRLYDLYDELCCRVSFFFHRLRYSRRRPRRRKGMIRGTAHSIISVTPPEPEMFREVLFILKDDYLRMAGDSEALMREAREAAEQFTDRLSPPKHDAPPILVRILPVLTAALGFLLGRLL